MSLVKKSHIFGNFSHTSMDMFIRKEIFIMAQLSEKELSLLNESLSEEELLVKKYQMLAQHSQDPEIKQKFQQVSDRHQRHFNDLYSLLG